jgi:hypothetical protein
MLGNFSIQQFLKNVAATAFEVNILKRPTILSPVLHTNLRKKGEIRF